MIPTSLALVPLLPERQAALQAIATVELAQQKGERPGRYPYAAAFMKQLSGASRISVKTLNRIKGIYLQPREKRAPLPEWESAQKGMNSWLVPNKLTARNILSPGNEK